MFSKNYSVPLPELLIYLNPLSREHWQHGAPSQKIVRDFIKNGIIRARHWSDLSEADLSLARSMTGKRKADNFWRFVHAGRIAFFVKNGIPSEDYEPVALCLNEGRVSIAEGRHRLAAAVVRQEQFVTVAFSDERKFLELLPSAILLPSPEGLSPPPAIQKLCAS